MNPPCISTALDRAAVRADVNRWIAMGWLKVKPESPKPAKSKGKPTSRGAWAPASLEAARTMKQTFSRDDMAIALKTTRYLAGNYMSQWHERGWIESVDHGQWRLTEKFGESP